MQWFSRSLNRKFLIGTAAGLLTISVVFMLLFLGMYRAQLERERSEASSQVNSLLQASLENAMLKRDLDGLRGIVNRLGNQEGIQGVMIINPKDEVRFSSHPEMLGRHYQRDLDPACISCHVKGAEATEYTHFTVDDRGREVLRSVNPVHNKLPCTECHGPIEKNPINGVLFVDYDAAAIRQNAQTTTLMLMGAGATVVLVTLLGGWWFMQNIVLKPVRQLHDTSQALATGDLAARVDIRGDDELAQLGRCFNEMAANLENTLQEIQEKDAFLQGLVDAVPDGLRVIDKDFRVILSNSAYRNQLNLAPEDGAGNPCYAASHGRAEPCPPTLVTCPVHEILRQKQTVKIFDQHQSSDDRPLPVEVVAAPLSVALHGESKILVVESIRDLEKQVQFSQEQRLAGLGQLAAGIAHEIHNPLSSIRLALDFLLRTSKQTEADPAKLHEYLMIVDKQIDRCIDVTERLLKLSSSAEHTHLVGVNAAIEETVSVVAWEAMAKNVTINQNLDSAQPRVLATESEYRMVVLNLIQNAFHAMPEGGHLDICSERRDGQVVLIVKDTGVGITREHQPHIFEPFFSHRADSNVGTGLGLSICKAITDRYGGHIDVDSQPGHGSRFRVVFSDAEVGERSTRE